MDKRLVIFPLVAFVLGYLIQSLGHRSANNTACAYTHPFVIGPFGSHTNGGGGTATLDVDAAAIDLLSAEDDFISTSRGAVVVAAAAVVRCSVESARAPTTKYGRKAFGIIMQRQESIVREGKGVWNQTVAIQCHGGICAVTQFEDGRDYVSYPNPALPLENVLSLWGMSVNDGEWYVYNSTELCIYGQAFGLHAVIDESNCAGMKRKTWKLFGGLQWNDQHTPAADL